MKKLLLFSLLMAAPLFAQQANTSPSTGQINGTIYANAYGEWTVPQGSSPTTGAITWPNAGFCKVQSNGMTFPAFTPGTSITIVDSNPSLTETANVTAVMTTGGTCSIQVAMVNTHISYYLESGTGGLQEALNANFAAQFPSLVVMTSNWYLHGGLVGDITVAKGNSNLGLIDVTTIPSNWYRWNGTQYVLVPIGGGNDVTSVFGRTGAVVAETGDYNCDQVYGCQPIAGSGWKGHLTAVQGSSDNVASIQTDAGVLPLSPYEEGSFFVDSEWEHFTGYIANGGQNYTLTGITRGLYQTTPAGHGSGTDLTGAIMVLSPSNLQPFMWIGDANPSVVSINCPFGDNFNGEVILQIGCNESGSTFYIYSGGSFTSNSSQQDLISNSLAVGVAPNTPNSPDQNFSITHTSNLLQSNLPNEVSWQIGFQNGIPDSVQANQPLNALAPNYLLAFVPTGSTTYTYACQGTDQFGNNIPGNPLNIPNLAASGWFGASNITLWCGPIPGATNVTLFRTAGGPNTGILATGSGSTLSFQDFYTPASSGSPNPTNTTIPVNCVNGTQFCFESGTSTTPTTTCSSSTQGWEYHITSATATPFAKVCNGTSWVTAY